MNGRQSSHDLRVFLLYSRLSRRVANRQQMGRGPFLERAWPAMTADHQRKHLRPENGQEEMGSRSQPVRFVARGANAGRDLGVQMPGIQNAVAQSDAGDMRKAGVKKLLPESLKNPFLRRESHL